MRILFEDVFCFPLIIPVFTVIFVKILSVVAFQFDCCIDIKNIRQLITFKGPGFISLLHLVPLLVTCILLFNLDSSIVRAKNSFDLI